MTTRLQVIDRLIDACTETSRHPDGVRGVMWDEEVKGGSTAQWPIGPEFDPLSLVTVRGADVRIIAIMALRQREGAFRRLVTGIQAQGMTPVVVQPITHAMRDIIRHWGWTCTVIGKGYESEEQWRPKKMWKA